MTNLKLAKLPDRTPTRITITVSADLSQALSDYQKLYAATYGSVEKIADLIPFMLEAFLDSDRAFAKARKEGLPEVENDKSARRSRSSRVGNADPASPAAQFASQPQED
ncbi:MAG: DUF2274 domain-containing protein [Parvibaculaceae bacterium]|jgi:hypothetical protein|nr:DUF2274 domain-containing protein [Parvibaculaceae bacterium]